MPLEKISQKMQLLHGIAILAKSKIAKVSLLMLALQLNIFRIQWGGYSTQGPGRDARLGGREPMREGVRPNNRQNRQAADAHQQAERITGKRMTPQQRR
jgi:hypothetical protein